MFCENIDMNLKKMSNEGECDYVFFFFVCYDLDPTVYFGVYLHENLFKRNDAICCICVIEKKCMENCILSKRALEI